MATQGRRCLQEDEDARYVILKAPAYSGTDEALDFLRERSLRDPDRAASSWRSGRWQRGRVLSRVNTSLPDARIPGLVDYRDYLDPDRDLPIIDGKGKAR